MAAESQSLMNKLEQAVLKKVDLADKSPSRYFVRAMLATAFLTLATNMAFMVGEKVNHVDPTHSIGKLMYALFFGWALVMILFMNSELFTSNAMYFSAKLTRKVVKPSKAAKVLVLCYIGNFVGAIAMSALIVYSGTWGESIGEFATSAVAAKLAKPPMDIFLQGIIANFVVNTAVIVSLNLKDDMAKVTSLVFIVFIFALFGSEHVIANFSAFSTVFFANNFAGFDLMAVLSNFLFATLGNIVGGGLLIGVVYVWLNKGDFKYKD